MLILTQEVQTTRSTGYGPRLSWTSLKFNSGHTVEKFTGKYYKELLWITWVNLKISNVEKEALQSIMQKRELRLNKFVPVKNKRQNAKHRSS